MEPAQRIAELETALATAERQLIESYPMASLGRLLAGIVHEINTPIGSIVSNNEVSARSLEMVRAKLRESAETGTPPPPKVLDVLDTLVSLSAVDRMACDRILSVIRGLKTHSRLGESDVRAASLPELIVGALKLACSEYKRRVKVETDFAALPDVECYPSQLSQVLLNLIVNAAQAIEGEGVIRLSTRQAGGMAEIEIADTGRGMTPEQQAKVFQQGFTTKPPGLGTGLGLSISHDIVVNQHKGSIEFESEPGKGTVFRIRVPFTQPKP
ncbi:MAG: hypothetical protein IT161_00535 [Bryobacterales bacterium]|nr:hypothetical protein [Bryobacterales bacterium]